MSAESTFTRDEMDTLGMFPPDVQDELLDSEFAGRKHYSRATYALGCRGPLCRLAETHRGRKRNETRATEAGRNYKPNLDARELLNDLELAPIIKWHILNRTRVRLERVSSKV